ncbi:MAG: hypothetical protein LBT39_06210, partial [Treponema sp.]|nr:hypothetical protein [Treponema sp.]
IDAEDTTTTYDGKNIGLNNNPGNRNNTSGQGVTTSVTWGSTFGEKENIYPHATLGFRFPDYNLETDSVGGSKTEAWEGSIWGLNGGLYWDLNDISTLDASVSLVGTFGSSTTGENKQTVAGGFGGGFEVGLINIIEPVDGLSLAAKPKLGAGVYGIDANESGDFTYNAVSQTDFALSFAVDLGIKARLPKKLNKFTLITGASLDVVNWEISGESGGAGNLKGYDRWSVTGFSWNGDNLAAGNSLGLGLVFAPNDHLTVGAGLNTLLDHFFKLDLVRMRLESGDFFSNGAPFYTGAGGAPLQFDLTVSYKL